MWDAIDPVHFTDRSAALVGFLTRNKIGLIDSPVLFLIERELIEILKKFHEVSRHDLILLKHPGTSTSRQRSILAKRREYLWIAGIE
jgi:hypothetical protein